MRKSSIHSKSLELWGNDLHRNKSAPPHSPQFEDVFGSTWIDACKGSLLEIGCGSGSDLRLFSENHRIKSLTAVDIGSNVFDLAKLFEDKHHVEVRHGNALHLEFDNSSFDVVYSFGVFHHTHSPKLCISEAIRVLKPGGYLFIYLYSSHTKRPFKRIGIFIETVIMSFMNIFPINIQRMFCFIISPFVWLLFSLPSIIIRLIGFKRFSKKIPFYFGTHPFSIFNDLKDRLISPINHRFSDEDIYSIFSDLQYSELNVVDNESGIYISAKK